MGLLTIVELEKKIKELEKELWKLKQEYSERVAQHELEQKS